MINAQYANEIEEIAHTILFSWRYNPKNEFGVLYLSINQECAYLEKLEQVYGRKSNLSPQVVGTFKVNLTKCLDLTDSSVREVLKIAIEPLIDPSDFTVTQSIAREARKLGFEAIIAPSAISEDCSSLVVFKDKLNPPSYCMYDTQSICPYP
ncbi:RES family NAD+ phosphorylase [candidate division WOR-3 bacterium]|nr:RES family NAD+ phosphorylase [candidate division WOR-3 bacterium]